MIPFEIMALITAIWVLIGAILVMPHFANKKMTQKGGKIDRLEQGFHKRLDRIEKKLPENLPTLESIQALEDKIPKNVPTMESIRAEIQAERKKTTENLQILHKDIPPMFIEVMKTKEFDDQISTIVKQHEGRLWRAKGIDMQQAQKGIDAAEQVFLEKIQNQDPKTQDRSELFMIIRDTIETAEKAGLIEEGSTDQKMGVVQGVMGIVDKLQARNKGQSSSPNRGGFLPPPPRYSGNELDYYR